VPAPRREAKLPPAEKEKPKEKEKGPSAAELLPALGTLTGAHLYQGYLNIGMLADGAEAEVYSPQQAKRLLGTVSALLDAADRQLARLPEEKLPEKEREPLKRARQIQALLRLQVKELRAYWDKGDKKHAESFHKARKEAWALLKDLLALDE
jgi:hypothetical protein